MQGNLMSTKQNPQNNNRNIRFPNQMIEQELTSLLSKRGQEFLSLESLKPAVGD